MNLDLFTSGDRLGTSVMTVNGTVQKTIFLLVVMIASAAFGWATGDLSISLGTGIAAFVIALITFFKPEASPITGPIYSVLQGVTLGILSRYFAQSLAETQYAGIVPLSVLATIVVFSVMLILYATRIIKVTEQFRAAISGACLAIFILYAGTFLIGFAWPGVYSMPIYSAGPIGIAFSIFVVGLAAFRLTLNFDFIERGSASGAPKVMEWYGAFALIVTIAWIYLEILQLLYKISRFVRR